MNETAGPAAADAGTPVVDGTATASSVAPRRGGLRRALLVRTAIGVAALAAGTSFAIAWAGGYRYVPVAAVAPAVAASPASAAETHKVERQLAALRPRGHYIVVDSTQNRLRIMKNDEVLREAIASAGTGAVLIDEATGRKWVFETPRGVRVVQRKKQKPCWTRPDWDYVENGEPLPKRFADRVDCAALGEYALYLGDGYMIHGTLYERSLGLSVTHGCVRLGAKDLEAVWKVAPVGTKVYLY
jgi:L,D-transpeptidase YbiS